MFQKSCLGLETDGKTDPGVKDSEFGLTPAREKDFSRTSKLSRNYFSPRLSSILQLWNSRERKVESQREKKGNSETTRERRIKKIVHPKRNHVDLKRERKLCRSRAPITFTNVIKIIQPHITGISLYNYFKTESEKH